MSCIKCSFSGVCKKAGAENLNANSVMSVALFLRGAGVSTSYIDYLQKNMATAVHAHQAASGFKACYVSP